MDTAEAPCLAYTRTIVLSCRLPLFLFHIPYHSDSSRTTLNKVDIERRLCSDDLKYRVVQHMPAVRVTISYVLRNCIKHHPLQNYCILGAFMCMCSKTSLLLDL